MEPIAMLCIDAGNPRLVREYVAAGHLPNLARVIERGRSATVVNEPGFFVGAMWPTLLTGTRVDNHGFYTGIRPAPGSYGYIPVPLEADPFWVPLSDAGRRVAVVDPPFFPARTDIAADQIIEWGCHDRYFGPSSAPPDLLDEVVREVGRHPIGMIDHEYARFAPCDWVHVGTSGRDLAQTERLIDDLRVSMEKRLELTEMLRRRNDYDVFIDVVGEVHCVGHQLWGLHDPSHPHHDPELLAAIGGDPLLPVYRLVDDLLGIHLDAIGPQGTAYVLASHGMRNHFDGTHLLDEALWRLDQRYRGAPTPWIGARTRRLARAMDALPLPGDRSSERLLGPLIRRTLGSRPMEATPPSVIPGPADRLWSQLENHTVSGAIRFNRVGRESAGLIDPHTCRHAARWIEDELRSIINVDTGEPAIEHVWPTEELYTRDIGDGLPDLIVEWNHTQPIDRIWSPTLGLICVPYDGLRTGDHDILGELYTMAPGVTPGERPAIASIDLAPTVAASAGVGVPGSDGSPIADLVPPERRTAAVMSAAATEPLRQPTATSSGASDVDSLRGSMLAMQQELNGLKAAHHETRMAAAAARQTADVALDVMATTASIAHRAVAEDLTISVIVPTRDRAHVLPRAIGSILEQTYENLEVIVVDDASTDATAAFLAGLDETRVRSIRNGEPHGEGGARNDGLDIARGDIVCFLDDDNQFDPAWLRSVAWLFQTTPDTKVAYGARLVDDRRRHREHIGGGLPELELNEWDDALIEERCLVDVNVLAHRRSTARFETDLPLFTDWAYLLDLSVVNTPQRLPVIATRYSTAGEDRVTFTQRPDHDRVYERVRTRPRRPAQFQSDAAAGVQASNA